MISHHRHLEVFVAGKHAGELRMSPQGALSFIYDSSYDGPDLSVALPFSSVPHSGKTVYAWFDNLLPDDPQVRLGMAAEAKSSTGLFPLLQHFGLDLPGAVQAVAPDNLASLYQREEGYVQLTRSQVAERLARIAAAEDEHRARAWAQSDEHWSLGGMQTKLALREWDGRWHECLGASASNVIVKPGAWGLHQQALVECVTMDLARRCGLPSASVKIESFDGMPALVAQRYDRFTSPDTGAITRIHQEDFCQATGTVSTCKYAADGGPSALDLMEILNAAEGNSRGRFVDALLFNYLTASTDAHAKNYSILHPEGRRFLLAPLYDLASAAPYLKKGKTYHLAMSVGGENRLGWLRKSTLSRFAQANDLELPALTTRIDELAEAIKQNLETSLNAYSQCEGIDELAETLIPRLTALCTATQRNISCESAHFKPVDITRFGR